MARVRSRKEPIFKLHLHADGSYSTNLFGYELLAHKWGEVSNEKLFPIITDTIDKLLFLSHLETVKADNSPCFYFVNIKPTTLLKYFHEIIHQVPTGRVVFEIREDYLDKEDTLEIKRLREEYMFLLSIDDFGSGASNFDRVKTLKPNFVKVEIPLFNKREIVFVSSMLRKSLPHAHLIAEKVEDEETLSMAIAGSFAFYQGWLFSDIDAAISSGK
ncbi:EAL domain-containing protein [Hydrogenivirga sp.]